jgi:MGT family glycosyltransferase
MSKFLICTISVIGHVSPALPIARELVDRGHQVYWYTGREFQAKVASTGAHFMPAVDLSPEWMAKWMARRNALQGVAQLKFDLKYGFIDAAVQQVQDLTEILRDFPADVILADFCFLGAAWLHEQGGPPWAGFSVSALAFSSRDTAPFGLGLKPDASALGQFRNRGLNWLTDRVLFKEVTTYMNQVRADLGLAPSQTSFFNIISPFLHLVGSVPEFEYPRRDLPDRVHFVGPLLGNIATEFTPPDWWEELNGDIPVIHVTQGTITTDPERLIVPTLQALASENVLVVATTFDRSLESLLPEGIPANARIASFIPYLQLLPHVDLMITNGGFNGVQMALANGVPVIGAGKSEDKPEICARIEWLGVGIDLKADKPTPAQIRSAVAKVLADPGYQNRAQDLQRRMSEYDAPSIATTLLEQLATTQQPVTDSSAAAIISTRSNIIEPVD